MAGKNAMREWDWPAFWRGFFEGYGRAHFVGMVALLIGWWVAEDTASATAFSVTTTYLFWSAGSAIYAYGSGAQSVGKWRESKA
jgi:hypothetical protein